MMKEGRIMENFTTVLVTEGSKKDVMRLTATTFINQSASPIRTLTTSTTTTKEGGAD